MYEELIDASLGKIPVDLLIKNGQMLNVHTRETYEANVGVYNESMDTSSQSISTQIATLKVGYGDIALYAIEFSLDYVNNTSEIFHPNDGIKYGIHVDLIKAFDFGLFLNPYLKGGFGAGALESTAKENKNSLSFGSFNLGTGIFVPINIEVS